MDALDRFAAWMDDGDHRPQIIEDYGGGTIECANRRCLAGTYDWLETHLHDWKNEEAQA